MLFDLRGRGRRSTIKVIYVSLAILMGGGLVLFGIGGSVSGGLVDAITGSSGGSNDSRLQKKEDQAEAVVRTRPNDAAAWAQVARARYLVAGQGDNFDQDRQAFTDAGKTKLREVDAAWQKHLELAGDKADDRVAALMVQVYGPGGLNKPDQAAEAQEVITVARPESSGAFANLAVLSYQAGETRKGDLAAKKAVELADKDQRGTLKEQLDAAKQEALQQSLQGATGSG